MLLGWNGLSVVNIKPAFWHALLPLNLPLLSNVSLWEWLSNAVDLSDDTPNVVRSL
jgi:hypothetical protein